MPRPHLRVGRSLTPATMARDKITGDSSTRALARDRRPRARIGRCLPTCGSRHVLPPSSLSCSSRPCAFVLLFVRTKGRARARPLSIMLVTVVRQKATVRQRRSDLPHVYYQHRTLQALVCHLVHVPPFVFHCCCIFALQVIAVHLLHLWSQHRVLATQAGHFVYHSSLSVSIAFLPGRWTRCTYGTSGSSTGGSWHRLVPSYIFPVLSVFGAFLLCRWSRCMYFNFGTSTDCLWRRLVISCLTNFMSYLMHSCLQVDAMQSSPNG